jgi:hypothetical protein
MDGRGMEDTQDILFFCLAWENWIFGNLMSFCEAKIYEEENHLSSWRGEERERDLYILVSSKGGKYSLHST